MSRDGDPQTAIEVCLQAERFATQYRMQRPDWRIPVEYYFWTQALLAELHFDISDANAANYERRAIEAMKEHAVRFDGWPNAMMCAFYTCCARIEDVDLVTEQVKVADFLATRREDKTTPLANAILAWFVGDVDGCREQLDQQPLEDLDGIGLFVTRVLDSAVCHELGQEEDATFARTRAEEQLAYGGVSPHYMLQLRMSRFLQQVVNAP